MLVGMTNRVEKILSSNNIDSASVRRDIDDAIELTVQNDDDSFSEMDFLKSIVKFSDVNVRQIMRPAVDVVAIDSSSDFDELMEVVRSSGYSRIPVYDENMDDIKGILYVKDLLVHLSEKKKFNWQKLIRADVLYAPESKLLPDLMNDFKARKTHMCIVVDEYGGTAGILTLEDVLEEVIGDIKDEFDSDEEDTKFKKINANTFAFDAKTAVIEVARIVGSSANQLLSEKGDAESIGGLILEVLGEFPVRGAEIPIGKVILKVTKINKRRIENVHVLVNDSAENVAEL